MQVLALSIVVVFCLGLMKLWWTTRAVRKQEIIDEEKRTRLTEMRKTGLPSKRNNEIPFGVRALQSGIEVDGIWVSQPGTPSLSSTKSKLGAPTTTILEIENAKADSRHLPEDLRSMSSTTLGKQPAQRAWSGLSAVENSQNDGVDAQSTLPTPLPQISEDSALPSHHHHLHRAGKLNEEALRRLDGQTPPRLPLLTTSIPSSRLMSPASSISRHHYRPSKRDSASSSESISSSGSSRNPSSSSSQRSFSAKAFPADGRLGYATLLQTSPEEGRAAVPGALLDSHEQHLPDGQLVRAAGIAAPACATQPGDAAATFGPGDTYANRATRKVNAGFEVLPARTFGPPQDLSRSSSGDSRDDEEDHGSRFARKLRRLSTQSLRQQVQ